MAQQIPEAAVLSSWVFVRTSCCPVPTAANVVSVGFALASATVVRSLSSDPATASHEGCS